MINVTKTFLPPIDDYNKQVQRAWDNQWLTNRGELVLELEEKLKDYLSISNILYVPTLKPDKMVKSIPNCKGITSNGGL